MQQFHCGCVNICNKAACNTIFFLVLQFVLQLCGLLKPPIPKSMHIPWTVSSTVVSVEKAGLEVDTVHIRFLLMSSIDTT